ncbi:hypothetical protein BDW02DRAFT_497957 [Decorospora gaudefroyi]|uniref:Uncharacterized protein n=1 Tax=Decorospora gaudefroyi TaxID=184978 RepID=A0A6A5KDX8_9PLEO|nr:hypothetical protein BDW02DRAFT_497957 [Decorospora gaudefroyi]
MLYRNSPGPEPRHTPSHQHQTSTKTSTRHNATKIDLILDAIAAIKAREPGESFSYREVAKRFGVNRSTLSRRH